MTPLRTWAAIAALVVVAGCGGGSDSDGPAIKETTAAATTPAPTATTSDPQARPKDERSDAGAIAFSAFVVNRIVAVTTGSNIDDVLTLATDDCAGCIALAKDTRKAGTVKQEFESAPTISDAKVIDTNDDKTQYLVEQTLQLSPGRKVDTATGKTVETFDDPTTLSVRVLCEWAGDRWVIANYSSKKASA
jgi:hypothetical protein